MPLPATQWRSQTLKNRKKAKMKKYEVTEVFRSIQGEGPQAGLPAVFVRFSGCNLGCSFCDEALRSGNAYTAREIREQIRQAIFFMADFKHSMAKPVVVLTGGEPLMQVDRELIDALDMYTLAIETNGDGTLFKTDREAGLACTILQRIQTVVVSPKTSMVSEEVLRTATHLKMLIPYQDVFDRKHVIDMFNSLGTERHSRFDTNECRVFLQPITPLEWIKDPRPFRMHAQQAVIEAVKLNNEGILARVIPQTHVFMGLK